jgi:amidase
VPIAHSQDTAGPMARTVTDAALLLAALAGPDSMDEATANAQGHIEADYTRFLDKAGLKGARIGVARKRFWGYSPEADAVCEAALEAMRAQGAVMVDPADIPNAGELDEPELLVLLYEFKADLNAYLKTWAPAAPVRSLAELIAFDEQNRDREMPFFGQDLFEKAQAKGSLYEKEYVKALERCRKNAREKGLDEVLGKRGLDAIVAPTGSPAWPIDLINGDHFLGASSTPAAVSGYPSITLPVGQSFGLPIGLTFIGARWAEGTLIKLAYSLEQAIGARKPPRFVPTVDLEERRTTISRRVGALVREATA